MLGINFSLQGKTSEHQKEADRQTQNVRPCIGPVDLTISIANISGSKWKGTVLISKRVKNIKFKCNGCNSYNWTDQLWTIFFTLGKYQLIKSYFLLNDMKQWYSLVKTTAL